MNEIDEISYIYEMNWIEMNWNKFQLQLIFYFGCFRSILFQLKMSFTIVSFTRNTYYINRKWKNNQKTKFKHSNLLSFPISALIWKNQHFHTNIFREFCSTPCIFWINSKFELNKNFMLTSMDLEFLTQPLINNLIS